VVLRIYADSMIGSLLQPRGCCCLVLSTV
jgi:hypothetical protein